MKNIIVIILLTILGSCAASKKAGNKNFQLTKAEKQAYVLGVKLNNGKTSGITHSMFFDVKGDVKVDKLWINGVNIDFEKVKTSESSIRIRATFFGGTKSNIHENIKAPIEFDGKALVQYIEGEETKYIVVKEFKEYKKMEGAK